MLFPTFRIGPQRGGRGYRMLATSGVAGDAGWTGNLPLVLLEWAKLRSPTPFSGRFPVAGGAVILRARYAEEGTDGPVAYANGVFVPEEALALVVRNEGAVVRWIDTGDDFGQVPLDIDDAQFATAAVYEWPGLGLAWRDRQVELAACFDPEDAALRALASVVPIVQRRRITGWSTTSRLETRGDFAPIRGCNLLVTGPGEPRGPDRFLPYMIAADHSISGEQVAAPAASGIWDALLAAGRPVLPDHASAALDQAWVAAMADWSPDMLARFYLETVSQQGATFAGMVDAIGVIAAVCSDTVTAAAVRHYLDAVRGQSATVIAGLLHSFAARFAALPETLGVVHAFCLRGDDGDLIAGAETGLLLSLAEAFAEQARQPVATPERARRRLRDFEDAALRNRAGADTATLRATVALARQRLGRSLPRPPHPIERAEAHRLLTLRRTNPLHPG